MTRRVLAGALLVASITAAAPSPCATEIVWFPIDKGRPVSRLALAAEAHGGHGRRL